MIVINRSDRMSIHVRFDSPGAADLLRLVNQALEGATNAQHVDFFRSVTTKKRHHSACGRTLSINEGQPALVEQGNALTCSLEHSTLLQIRQRLQDARRSGAFEPAEIGPILVVGRAAENDLYFIYAPEAGTSQPDRKLSAIPHSKEA